jgi:hypothetical protein
MATEQPISAVQGSVRAELKQLADEGLWDVDVSKVPLEQLRRLSIFGGSDEAPAAWPTFRGAFHRFLKEDDQLAGAMSEMAIRLFGVERPYRDQTPTGRLEALGEVEWRGKTVLYDGARRAGGRRDKVLDRVARAVVQADAPEREWLAPPPAVPTTAPMRAYVPPLPPPGPMTGDATGSAESNPIRPRLGRWHATMGVAALALGLAVASWVTWGNDIVGGGATNTQRNSSLVRVASDRLVAAPLMNVYVPSVATSVTAAALSGSTVEVKWHAAHDKFGLFAYEIYRNEGQEPIAIVPGSQTSYRDDSVTPNTAYTYYIRVTNVAGNTSSTSKPVRVHTPEQRAAAPPTISLTAPLNGASVSGVVTLAALAKDTTGIREVIFLAKGAGTEFELVGTQTPAASNGPYTTAWNTDHVAHGTYTIQAYAIPGTGRFQYSNVVTVIVNGSPPG